MQVLPMQNEAEAAEKRAAAERKRAEDADRKAAEGEEAAQQKGSVRPHMQT
mgnify:CR=1 FL=1